MKNIICEKLRMTEIHGKFPTHFGLTSNGIPTLYFSLQQTKCSSKVFKFHVALYITTMFRSSSKVHLNRLNTAEDYLWSTIKFNVCLIGCFTSECSYVHIKDGDCGQIYDTR